MGRRTLGLWTAVLVIAAPLALAAAEQRRLFVADFGGDAEASPPKVGSNLGPGPASRPS